MNRRSFIASGVAAATTTIDDVRADEPNGGPVEIKMIGWWNFEKCEIKLILRNIGEYAIAVSKYNAIALIEVDYASGSGLSVGGGGSTALDEQRQHYSDWTLLLPSDVDRDLSEAEFAMPTRFRPSLTEFTEERLQTFTVELRILDPRTFRDNGKLAFIRQCRLRLRGPYAMRERASK